MILRATWVCLSVLPKEKGYERREGLPRRDKACQARLGGQALSFVFVLFLSSGQKTKNEIKKGQRRGSGLSYVHVTVGLVDKGTTHVNARALAAAFAVAG